MNLRKLPFNLTENVFGDNKEKITHLVDNLKGISKSAGTGNDRFKKAWKKIFYSLQQNENIEQCLDSRVDIRALGFALSTEFLSNVKITKSVLDRIDQITPIPSALFVENLFQYYLNEFNDIENLVGISQWLIRSRKARGLEEEFDENLISVTGAKWIAEKAIREHRDFDQVITGMKLNQFQFGQFMESAQRIYYVEQLKVIPINKPHDLLIEIQKPEIYKAKFDDSGLLGHQILKILIDKAPSGEIHESWLNVIMAIAGDPRIPKSHQRYITWWSHVPQSHIAKVEGWLSRLDLKLFLEALEDYAGSSSDPQIKRMYPSRKRFLEGLYDRKLIRKTRLYLSSQMASFLRKNYKAEHMPDYSVVTDGDKSIIYVDLGNAHLLEGSHSCYLWVYKSLDHSAIVFADTREKVTYSGLTSGLDRKMSAKGCGSVANITHNSARFSWQRTAIQNLKNLGVSVSMKDVLTSDDYRKYVRIFGVN